VSFARDIRPIFNGRCVDCHWPGSPIGVDLLNPFDPDEGIIERHNSWLSQGSEQTLIVDPGNVSNSFLVKKLAEPELDRSVDGAPMPLQIEVLTQAELDAVSQWITDGAQNDAFFSAQVAPIFGTALTLGRAAGKCTFCHYPGALNGMSVLDVFDPDEGMVGVESRFGGTIVVPGDPESSILMQKLLGTGPGEAMPWHPPRLSEQQVQLVIDWIAEGAKNN
jgi:mono/diheme cytochrome c family protein